MAPASDRRETITKILRASAEAAATQCVYGDNGTTCALKWYGDESNPVDSDGAVNQNLNALEVFLANLPIGEIMMGNGSANGTGTGSSTTGGANGSEGATESQSPEAAETSTGAASSLLASSMLVAVGVVATMLVLA
jgi:mannan endo-1,6-alpha-mannosidase